MIWKTGGGGGGKKMAGRDNIAGARKREKRAAAAAAAAAVAYRFTASWSTSICTRTCVPVRVRSERAFAYHRGSFEYPRCVAAETCSRRCGYRAGWTHANRSHRALHALPSINKHPSQ